MTRSFYSSSSESDPPKAGTLTNGTEIAGFCRFGVCLTSASKSSTGSPLLFILLRRLLYRSANCPRGVFRMLRETAGAMNDPVLTNFFVFMTVVRPGFRSLPGYRWPRSASPWRSCELPPPAAPRACWPFGVATQSSSRVHSGH